MQRGIVISRLVKTCIRAQLEVYTTVTPATCCSSRIMPANMMSMLLNLLYKMFDNSPTALAVSHQQKKHSVASPATERQYAVLAG